MRYTLCSVVLLLLGIASSPMLISQPSAGGQPKSFSMPYVQERFDVVVFPAVNVDSLLKADIDERHNGLPYRFGFAINTNLGLHNAGSSETMSDGSRLWRLKVVTPGAVSVHCNFSRFSLPPGAELFIYDKDRKVVLGAYTHENNKPHQQFAISPVPGEAMILEYYEPAKVVGKGVLEISQVIHDYKDVMKQVDDHLGRKESTKKEEVYDFGDSQPCEINVNCPIGDDWCREKRSVVMIWTDNNTRWCSGSLLNNVRLDGTPYILTANHCLEPPYTTWMFWFGYWSPTCSNPGSEPPAGASFVGATLRASYAPTDFALLEMDDEPYSPHGVYYAGWDRGGTAPDWSVGIHHPRGDIMKISQDDDPTLSASSTHWHVNFDHGTAEHGSSGSPLFNPEHRVVGQLHGNFDPAFDGDNYCEVPHIWYGKFSVSWDRTGSSSGNRLRDWLDPDNTGATTLDAHSPEIFLRNRTLTGTHIFVAERSMQVEGNMPAPTVPANTPFTVEPGADVTMKAGEVIHIKNHVHVKAGSAFHAYIDPIDCDDVLHPGDAIVVGVDNPPVYPEQIIANGISIAPNPVYQTATVRYYVSRPGSVVLTVSNALGQEIEVPVRSAGHGSGWHTITMDVSKYAPGIYFSTLRTAAGVQTLKFVVVQ